MSDVEEPGFEGMRFANGNRIAVTPNARVDGYIEHQRSAGLHPLETATCACGHPRVGHLTFLAPNDGPCRVFRCFCVSYLAPAESSP